MGTEYILLILFITLTALILIILFLSRDIQRKFNTIIKKGLNRTAELKNEILTLNDIKTLPALVQSYLINTGVIGKEKVMNLRTVSEIDINLGDDKGNALMKALEYNFFDQKPTRTVIMKFKTKGLPVYGLDSYTDGNGSMLMEPLGLFKAVDAKGNDMDNKNALVMLFLNMCAVAPATLIDSRIKWTVIDSSTIKAFFNDNLCNISATLTFNNKCELIDFSTEDRYYCPTGKTYQNIRWSTPLLNYRNINGLNLSTYGEAIWHFPDRDFCYGKLTIKEIEYNVKS
jgi:hypothetical protein